MTTNNTETIRQLLREFVGAYVERPEALRVEFQAAENGDVYWGVKGHSEDDGKLVGIGGTHVDALELILREIGRAAGHVYTFRLHTTPHSKGGPKSARRDALTYDPTRAQVLLSRLLVALGIAARVGVSPGNGPRNALTYKLTLVAATPADYGLMVANRTNCPEATIVCALGTLFRAIAMKEGVRFQIAATP